VRELAEEAEDQRLVLRQGVRPDGFADVCVQPECGQSGVYIQVECG